MRSPLGVIIFTGFMLLVDLYIFQAVKAVIQSSTPRTKSIVQTVYWAVSVLSVVGFIVFVFTDPQLLGKKVRTYLFASIIGLFLAKLVAIIFLVIDDLRRLIQWLAGKMFFEDTEGAKLSGEGISRSVFLSWLGIAAGTTLFASLLYGFSNKYNYHLRKLKLPLSNLPDSFRGLKIIQISDIHCGSFTDKKAVLHGVEMVMKEKPDIIFFTGDLVNDRATEMSPYMDVFGKLKAPMGVYSTLGNHDYGDYAKWPKDGVSKSQNLENLKQVHADLGWKLLMNEHVVLNKNGDEVALLGVENWSIKGNFPKYGNMEKAYKGTEKYPFKILLTHDPSHWNGEITEKYKDVSLTFSGHTHGMQFGVEVPGFRWSPVQYMYKQWAGLYENDGQKLYVNRGFGFIGYPGRVGILPEITLIELS